MGRLAGFNYREITKRLKKFGFVFQNAPVLRDTYMGPAFFHPIAPIATPSLSKEPI